MCICAIIKLFFFSVNYVIWLDVWCVCVCVCVCVWVCDVGCICWCTVHGLACYCCCTVLAFFLFFFLLCTAHQALVCNRGSRWINISLLLLLSLPICPFHLHCTSLLPANSSPNSCWYGGMINLGHSGSDRQNCLGFFLAEICVRGTKTQGRSIEYPGAILITTLS